MTDNDDELTRPIRVLVYRDKAGEWRWRARAANGKVVGDSGEGYVELRDCVAMARATTPPSATIVVEEQAD